MKITFLFILILVMACNKDSKTILNEPLQGVWEMTDSYIGNGDGSITHQSVDDVNFKYTVTDSLYSLYYDVMTSTSLKNITDSTYITENSNLPFKYKITGSTMELKHACDEGCKYLFKKSSGITFPF